jgi:hypothetical protein
MMRANNLFMEASSSMVEQQNEMYVCGSNKTQSCPCKIEARPKDCGRAILIDYMKIGGCDLKSARLKIMVLL